MAIKYKKNNEKYWKDRAFLAETMQEKTSAKLLRDRGKVYRNSLADLQREIETFYGRYATENGLDMAEVHKRLDPKKIANAMADRYNLDYKNCKRLARAETIHAMNAATYDSYREHGIEKYQFVCGLDGACHKNCVNGNSIRAEPAPRKGWRTGSLPAPIP